MNTHPFPSVPDADATPAPKAAEVAASGPRVMICCGDDQRRAALASLLRALPEPGVRLLEAPTGTAAAHALCRGTVDWLLVDDRLPDMRAAQLLQRVAEAAELPPCIVLAEPLSEVEAAQLIERGVLGICPPASPAAVAAACRGALELWRAHGRCRALDAQVEQLRAELAGAEQRDPLTGVHNSRAFYATLDREFRRSARNSQPMSLLVADVDFLTAYNYTYGHEAGDECLQAIARGIDTTFQRAGDMVAHIGGGTFAVLLADTNNQAVAAQAERLRERIYALELLCNSSRAADRVTLSVGVATTQKDFDKGWEHLLQTACNALFHAKAQGRNWVEVAAAM